MPEKLDFRDSIKKAIGLLCQKQVSKCVILSSYKVNAVLKTNYGINIRVDKVGRVLSAVAKKNNLQRLSTNIPKYLLDLRKTTQLVFTDDSVIDLSTLSS